MKSLFTKKTASKALFLSTISFGIVTSTLGTDNDRNNQFKSTTPKPGFLNHKPIEKFESKREYIDPIDFPITIKGFMNATIMLDSLTHPNTVVSFEKRELTKGLDQSQKPPIVIYKLNTEGLENLLRTQFSIKTPKVNVHRNGSDWTIPYILYIPDDCDVFKLFVGLNYQKMNPYEGKISHKANNFYLTYDQIKEYRNTGIILELNHKGEVMLKAQDSFWSLSCDIASSPLPGTTSSTSSTSSPTDSITNLNSTDQ